MKREAIKATLEIVPIDGKDIRAAIADAIRRAVPGSDPTVIGPSHTGFRLDGSFYSTDTPAELAGLYLRGYDGHRVEPLTIVLEFSWIEDVQ